MKEELIRDNSTLDRDHQGLMNLLDYARQSLTLAEESAEVAERNLDEDFVISFADYAGWFYKAQLKVGYYRRLIGKITDENTEVCDVRGYLRYRRSFALRRLTATEQPVGIGSPIRALESTWCNEFFRFDYTESGRLLERYFGDDPDQH